MDRLITTMIFAKQYVNRVDRTMAYFVYEGEGVREVDDIAILFMEGR